MATLNSLALTFLTNALWQIALLGGVAALAARLLRSTPARYRHVLWLAALFLSVSLPLASLRAFWGLKAGNTPLAPSAPAPPESTLELPHAPGGGLPADSSPANSLATVGGSQPLSTRGAGLVRARRLPVSLPPAAASVIVGAYFLFLLYRAVRLIGAWRRTRMIRAGAHPGDLPPAMAAIAARARAALGLQEVALLCSRDVVGPQTLGIRRPVILLPASLFDNAVADDLATALGHEMAHAARRDFLLNLVCELILLPVAFHPLAAFLKRRIDESRELACDELAAGRVLSASAYAHSLVSLARRIATPDPQPGCSLGVFDAGILEERIMRLLDKRPRTSSRRALILLGSAAIALAMSGLIMCLFSFTAHVSAAARGSHEAGNDGGVPGADERKSGVISGTVSDPSRARVPEAVVSLYSDSGFHKTDATSDTGEFSFTGVPAGRYHFKVAHAGFEVFERILGVKPDGTVELDGKSYAPGSGAAGPRLEVTLEPGRIVQVMEVTAKAPQGVLEKRHASRPQRMRVGGQVEAAKLVVSKRPKYPESARLKGIEGEVLLEAVISKEGVPLSLHVLWSPDPALTEAALAAVREWRYKPMLLNGEPIEVLTTIAVAFHLEG